MKTFCHLEYVYGFMLKAMSTLTGVIAKIIVEYLGHLRSNSHIFFCESSFGILINLSANYQENLENII